MSNPDYDDLGAWQQKFLYTTDKKKGTREQFWNTVLKKALNMLSDNAELYQDWLGLSNKRQRVTKSVKDHDIEMDDSERPRPNNGNIKKVLADLLRKPIKDFFSHPVTKTCLRRITNNRQELPFLFIIDEAAYLSQTNYNHTFMWVLDQPVVQILNELYLDTPDSYGLAEMPTDRFFVLMLGTHSHAQTSHFAPNIFPSDRLAGNPQLSPSPFLSFNWDENVKEFRPPFKLRDSESLFELQNWGRSMWAALFEGRSNSDTLRRCINYVKKKLEPAEKNSNFHRELSVLAVMSIRLHLDLDCAASTRASLLVCSKMRWLVGISRTHVITTYGNEPLLVEAAACMMNSYDGINSKKSNN